MRNMFRVIIDWFRQYFSDPEAMVLLLTLVAICAIVWIFGGMLFPIFVSIVIAYFLDGMVNRLQRWKIPHILAVSIVCLLFVSALLIGLLWLMPLLWEQAISFFNQLPTTVGRAQSFLMLLPNRYPAFVSADQVQHFIEAMKVELGSYGKTVLAHSLSWLPNVIELIVYLVLVPLLVFFFLKDRDQILAWVMKFLPKRRTVITRVWNEVNTQIGNYVRARILEMIIVGFVSSVTFAVMGLEYAVLLGVLVGVATVVPYIGAIVSTIPIVVIAFLQWGWSAHFLYLIIAYTVISIVDSNVLVPLLFSETMDLHPVAIIVAVVIFGGLWGFWGIFFAIPLATVVKAVIREWPTRPLPEEKKASS